MIHALTHANDIASAPQVFSFACKKNHQDVSAAVTIFLVAVVKRIGFSV